METRDGINAQEYIRTNCVRIFEKVRPIDYYKIIPLLKEVEGSWEYIDENFGEITSKMLETTFKNNIDKFIKQLVINGRNDDSLKKYMPILFEKADSNTLLSLIWAFKEFEVIGNYINENFEFLIKKYDGYSMLTLINYIREVKGMDKIISENLDLLLECVDEVSVLELIKELSDLDKMKEFMSEAENITKVIKKSTPYKIKDLIVLLKSTYNVSTLIMQETDTILSQIPGSVFPEVLSELMTGEGKEKVEKYIQNNFLELIAMCDSNKIPNLINIIVGIKNIENYIEQIINECSPDSLPQLVKALSRKDYKQYTV